MNVESITSQHTVAKQIKPSFTDTLLGSIKSIQNKIKSSAPKVHATLSGEKKIESRIPGKMFQLAMEYQEAFPPHHNVHTSSLDSLLSMENDPKKPIIDYFDRVIVIGDSLSDSEKRMYHKSKGLIPRSSQYYKGKFTNGSVWTEFLTMPSIMQSVAFHKGISHDPKVTLINRAEGGAPCASYSTSSPKFRFLSNMEKQIKGLNFTEKDLVIVFIGANDYLTYHKTDVNFVVLSQKKSIEKMVQKGARQILVMGIPDLSQTPYAKKVAEKKPKYRQEMQRISIEHNHKLRQLVELMNLQQPCRIMFFDVNNTMDNIMNVVNNINARKPGSYEVNKAFSHGYIFGNAPLEIDPHYVFVDEVHPTQEIHHIIAMELHHFIYKNFNPQNKSILISEP
ncbi:MULTISPECIES: SGNH/GDSL hydrolase family protein [Providencia]|uniref:GDSL-like protein n=1 Tax=Providencia stuartii ATCC 25827 TaxID=471874 RepID=A0AA87CUX3_PROST|nr:MULTISPECIES: SGNH/GDSL hydrolase family protein [Providencia]EDU61515.1 GDSL-like protein [Providencia stuartii ATCC 25827]EMD1718215.1 hypothetical protein [Providencia stuartii]MBG5908237.1 hypothetical protein [Providencia stuartii]MDK7737459.1 SGNH/GDSL hydrolase family protein [Providencia stuartii]MDT2043036.1 SGNH/GDSL hydrolase family protein [Providencia stuartii]